MTNEQDVRRWLREVIGPKLGGAFHPDTRFTDYIEIKTGHPTFSAHQAARLQAQLTKAFVICEDLKLDLYGLCIEELKNF